MSEASGRHVVVIGTGIVGAATAIELRRDGQRVTLLDPDDPGGFQAASYGNGGWISPASVVPLSMPGMWRKIPGYLVSRETPLAISWRYLPTALPWLRQMILAGATVPRVERIARALRPLVADGPQRHAALAAEAGVGALIRRTGLLYIFPDRADFEADALAWRLRRDNGVRWVELDDDELHRREPALHDRYGFGICVEDGAHCVDPGAYVAALAAHAQAQGATLVRSRATGFTQDAGRLRAVQTEAGEIACDRAVIAAGAWSKPLAQLAGDDVALETGRGYLVVIRDPGFALGQPIMPSDGQMANIMTPQGLRLAGQMEIAGLEAKRNVRRARVLFNHALGTYPGLPSPVPRENIAIWMGHRPSTPDSLPCIGPASGCADIVHCFGHGHIGLAAGAISGRLAADLVAGRTPVIDPAPYDPGRFN